MCAFRVRELPLPGIQSARSFTDMEPVINIEETIGKIVGRRRSPAPMQTSPAQIAESEQWRSAFGGTGIPKGVYRFKSHEAANEWWDEQVLLSKKREGR